jgi:hypothetical protein
LNLNHHGKQALEVLEQPANYWRFRYEAEGRENCLGGRQANGSFPSVAVHPDFQKRVPPGAMVQVSLVTRHCNHKGEHQKHWHTLHGKDNTATPQQLVGGVATFNNLVIKRAAKAEVRHKAEDQRVVRLLFQLQIYKSGGGGKTKIVQVVSDPIFSTEQRIERLSQESCPADGNTDNRELIVLCTKVRYKSVAMRIIDPVPYMDGGAYRGGVGGGGTARPKFHNADGWVLDSNNKPTYHIDTGALETHHQFAVIFKIPPYWDTSITEPKTVELRLLDTADDIESPPYSFVYTPTTPRPPAF